MFLPLVQSTVTNERTQPRGRPHLLSGKPTKVWTINQSINQSLWRLIQSNQSIKLETNAVIDRSIDWLGNFVCRNSSYLWQSSHDYSAGDDKDRRHRDSRSRWSLSRHEDGAPRSRSRHDRRSGDSRPRSAAENNSVFVEELSLEELEDGEIIDEYRAARVSLQKSLSILPSETVANVPGSPTPPFDGDLNVTDKEPVSATVFSAWDLLEAAAEAQRPGSTVSAVVLRRLTNGLIDLLIDYYAI